MKKTILGLAFTSLLLGATGGAFAADGAKNCVPHKPGYMLDASGKCVKAPSKAPIKQ